MRATRTLVALATLLVAGILLAAPLYAQPEQHPVHWSAPATISIRSGDSARVTLRATIAEFFHLYSTTQGPGGPIRTSVWLASPRGVSLVGSVRTPPPDTIPDANFGILAEVFDDSVMLGLTLRADPSVPRGRVAALIAVRYQACTARYCLPPRVDSVRVALVVAARGAGAVTGSTPPQLVERPPPVVAGGDVRGVIAFILLAASMGALALLTPCVFPMVPMTVMAFVGGGRDRRQGVRRAAFYALGIIGGFTVVGVLAAVLFGAAGLARFSASPVVNLAISGLFALFALSLVGVVELTLPRALMDRIPHSFAHGAAGSLAMGAVFTLAAFTCTAPFVGTLLVLAAEGGWGWPLIGMFVFSSVFAAPFFLLALAPAAIERIARPGEWMPAIETALGAIELCAAVKFASNADLVLGWGILTRRVVVLIWIAILAALVVRLLVVGMFHGVPGRRRSGRMGLAISAAASLAVAALVPGVAGHRIGEAEAFLPPMVPASGGPSGFAVNGELPWILNDYRGALASARRDGRPVLVDFTGYTCTNCRWMEANMFPRAGVTRALGRFVRVRLYTDGIGEPYLSQQSLEQRLFGTVALPYYAVLDCTGRARATFLGMTRDEGEFTRFLALGSREP